VATLGGPEVLRLAEVASPTPGAGEVLVHQSAVGVNFIDVYYRTGVYPRELPFIPGREAVGIVTAVGPEVTAFAPGTRVGYCDTPSLGGYAEDNAIPARFCVEIPNGVADDVGCAALLQGLTAQYLTTDSYALGPGDRALIHAAAGGVGRLLVQFAKHRGATVIATAGGPEKVALSRSAGADHVIDYSAVDFEPEVKRLTGGAGVDVVYDSVGLETWERSLRAVRIRGSLVLFGASSGPVPPIDPQRLSAAGSIFFSRPTLAHFTRTHGELAERAGEVFDGIRDGWLEVRVGHHYALADAAEAHRDLQARRTTGKLILRA
jgi:NADPH2:quinone reductase